MNKIKWAIKQLLPLTYRTEYRDEQERKHYTVWKMWFGRCFNINDIIYQGEIANHI